MLVQTEHPKAGATRAIGCPVKLSATPPSVRRPAPLYGEHTREVLLEFGFTGEEARDLINAGAAIQHATSADAVR
jgi:formyl-CoA transferase